MEPNTPESSNTWELECRPDSPHSGYSTTAQRTELTSASFKGRLDIVKELIAAGVDVNERDIACDTALILSSWEGHIEVVKELINAGADVNKVRCGPGYSALALAAAEDHFLVVRELIQSGADINKSSYSCNNGVTPLIMACANGNVQTVRELIKAGAHLEKTDGQGHTPMQVAQLPYTTYKCDFETVSGRQSFLTTFGYTREHANECETDESEADETIDRRQLKRLFNRQKTIVNILIAAGAKYYKIVTREEYKGEIRLRQMMDLKTICKLAIREQMRDPEYNLFLKVRELPLPQLLKDFLLYGQELE